MKNFTFLNPTKIIFGSGVENQTGEEVAHWSKRVLLHYGGGSIKKTGLYDRVTASLRKAGVEFVELGGVQPNPRLSLVHEGVRLCREHQLDFILAVGGGSAIDSAKAIAMGVPYSGDVWDFYSGAATPQEALPVGTVLTIPAAGSESSNSSVVTNEDGWYKRGCTSDVIYPVISFLNPELTYTLPAYQVACGAADIMAHLMERYFTNVENVELTDRLIEATMKTMIHNVPLVLAEPNNYAAWSEVMWAGTVAHNNLLDTGRIGDWASHGIEHEISGIYDVAHGAGLAVVFPAWMKYVYHHDVKRFAQFAARVWNVDYAFDCPERSALQGIASYEAFMHSIGLVTRLTDMHIPADRIPEMAAKATANDASKLGNFVKLGQKDVEAILRLAV